MLEGSGVKNKVLLNYVEDAFRGRANDNKDESLYTICVPQVAFNDRLLGIDGLAEMLN